MGSVTLREASELYKVPLTTLRQWRDAGLIRVLQEAKGPGHASYVAERDVEALAREYRPGRRGRGQRKKMADAVLA